MKNTLSRLLAGLALLALCVNTAFAVTTNLTAVADTYTRAGVNAGAATVLDLRGFGGGDFMGYLRFDLTGVPIKELTGATLSLNKVASARNDTIVTGRFANFGLINAAGNTPQNWDEATLAEGNVGAEYGGGTPGSLSNVFILDADRGAIVTESINNSSNPQTLSGPDLVTFLQQRLADNGLATIITTVDATGGRGWGYPTKENTNSALWTTLTLEYLPDTGLSNLLWTVGSGNWDINTTANWEDEVGGSSVYGPEVFDTGNAVTFEDTVSAGGNITVTVVTTVRPDSMLVDTANNYTFTGSGDIAGNGAITKTGSGTLTLDTVNTNYTGTISVNGGTTVFSQISNLGDVSAPIVFGGGTLQYGPGNTADISSHVVTLDTGGGTIDVGANSVLLLNPIGGNGAGGLTKTGSGSLELSGLNTYLGNTVVNQGSLLVLTEFNSSISNSPVITVASGATLDTGFYEFYLNGANNQKLTGDGFVDGFDIFVPSGSTVSPGADGVVGALSLAGATLDGGTVLMDVSQANNDQIAVSGSLTLNSGTVVLNVVGAPLANGTYTLMTYGFISAGSLGNLSITGFSQPGQVAFLSDATYGQIDLVVAPLSNNSLVWAGVNSLWDVGNSSSWLDGASASVFQHGDSVTFNSVGAGLSSVSLAELVFPSMITVDAATDYTIDDGGGRVAGTNALIKSGSGKLTVNTPNVNSGGTTINAGTVEVGPGGHIGGGAILNNGTLILAQTADRTSGGLSGSGSVTRSGTGTVTLSGGATHTGATTITTGTLQIGDGGAIGPIATSGVANEGVLAINTSSDLNLSTPVTGSGGLTKRGSGALTLSGVKSYTGTTFVDANGGTVVAGAANQILGTLTVQQNSTFDLNGFDQKTAGLTSTDFAGGQVTNSAPMTNTLTVTVENGGAFEASSASLNGPIKFVKLGSDELIIRAQGNMTGGAILGQGAMQIRDADRGLGEGLITVSNATSFQFDDFPVNDLLVVNGATSRFRARSLGNGWGGLISGTNATLIIDGPCSLGANTTYQFGNFDGTVIVETNGQLRFSSTSLQYNGGHNTTFDVRGTLHTRNATFGGDGRGIALGALTGDGNVTDFQSGSSPGTARYVIGAKGINATFTGAITDDPANNQFFEIVKVGGGTQTLAGTNNWSGSTTVSNGVLAVSGASGLTNNSAIVVAAPGVLDVAGLGGILALGATTNAQSLSGDGTITGSVVAAGTGPATIAPGFSAGELSISGNLTLAANSTVAMELDNSASPTSDKISATGTITGAGSLTVTNIGPLLSVGQVFTLFNQPVSGFASVAIATNDANGSYVFDNKIGVNGTIEVLAVTPNVDPTPTNITVIVSGGDITLEWPPSHTGWTLQAQTNALGVGLSNNWVDLGYQTTNSVTLPINPANPTVFYRLVLR